MVLESILNPKNAEDKPLHVFVITFFYSVIAIMFANQLFPSQASILTVSLITIIFIPFFQKLFELEEEKEDLASEGKIKNNVFYRHRQVVYVFTAFFMGIILSMTTVYIFLPSFDNVFSLQMGWFRSQGMFPMGSGGITADHTPSFTEFFLNNSQVMILMFMLSLILGAGAILILVWNASVIAVFAGLFIKTTISAGTDVTSAFFLGLPVSLSSIAPHGIPEIVAYFLAGLAGGVLSVGVMREKFGTQEFSGILRDSLKILIMAEFFISIAAFLEVAV